VLTTWRKDYGRPSQITPEKVAAIIQGVRAGMSYTGAAKRVGVYQQLSWWWKATGIKLDLQDDLDHSKLTEAEKLYILLARAVTVAQGEFEAEQTQKLLEEIEGDWRARGWLLERRFPESYSLKQHLRVDMQVSVPAAPVEPPVVRVVPFEERIRNLAELARERERDRDQEQEQPAQQARPVLPAPAPKQAAPRWRILGEDGRVQES
jgi:hypothetical protein